MKYSISFLAGLACFFSAFSQNVGIGTVAPQANLHINGTFRFTNGSQGAGKVLTSNSAGEVNWLPAGLALPYSGISSVAQPTFSIVNSGTSSAAGHFETYSGNTSYTLEAFNYSTTAGGAGVYGQTSNNENGLESAGILGEAIGTGNQAAGLRGRSNSGPGIIGISQNGAGVYGIANNGYAAVFSGLIALYTIGEVRLTGLGEAYGKVFTCDANGKGTWQTPAASGWGLTGNAGTVSASSFVGTTDNKPLNFRTNNIQSGIVNGTTTAFGYQSQLSSNAASNTSFGAATLKVATGDQNTAMGAGALEANTSGSSNVAIGKAALSSNIANSYLVAIGHSALRLNGSGTSGQSAVHNTGVGSYVLELNTSGAENTAVGYFALHTNDAGNYNTSMGWKALHDNTAGGNTAVGNEALMRNESGSNNTAIGFVTMNNYMTGSQNTSVGAFAGQALPASVSNVTCIGYNSGRMGASSNQVFLGNTSVTAIIANVTGITAYSDARVKDNVRENVAGLSFIKALRPVTYNLNIHNQDRLLNTGETMSAATGKKRPVESPDKYAGEKKVQTGFIAQEVEAAAKKAGYDFSGVSAPKNGQGLYGINYTEFVVPLVKAVQEQQLIIETQQKKINDQQAVLDAMEKRLLRLENTSN